MDFLRILLIASFAFATTIGCGKISQNKASGEQALEEILGPDQVPEEILEEETPGNTTPPPQTNPTPSIVNLGSCKLCDNAQNCVNNDANISECSTFYVDNAGDKYSAAQIDELKARMASDCSNGDQVFEANVECKAIPSIEPLLDDNNNGDPDKYSCKEDPIPVVQINNTDYDDIYAWHYHTDNNGEFNQDAGDCPIETD